MHKTHIPKVICYITHNERLLVFRHVDYSYEEVGIQVPAGSIKIGESPKEAARREVEEETGLREFSQCTFLGTSTYDITPYRYEIQERHFFHFVLTEPTPDRWFSQEDHDGMQHPTRFECFWIPLSAAHVLQSGQGALLYRLCM